MALGFGEQLGAQLAGEAPLPNLGCSPGTQEPGALSSHPCTFGGPGEHQERWGKPLRGPLSIPKVQIPRYGHTAEPLWLLLTLSSSAIYCLLPALGWRDPMYSWGVPCDGAGLSLNLGGKPMGPEAPRSAWGIPRSLLTILLLANEQMSELRFN